MFCIQVGFLSSIIYIYLLHILHASLLFVKLSPSSEWFSVSCRLNDCLVNFDLIDFLSDTRIYLISACCFSICPSGE